MQYRTNPKNGDKISALGFGGIRYPKDDAEAERLILQAVDRGINLFDTAYIYMRQRGERVLGNVFEKNSMRDKVYISAKMPPYLLRSAKDIDKYFNAELSNLKSDYIDYYHIHMLSDIVTWKRLKSLGMEEWIYDKKKSGQIRNIGFSFHGGRQDYISLLDDFDWDMTLIQYNYMDENNQAGRKGLEYAASKGLPTFIMEPLRGGRLVNALPGEVEQKLVSAGRKPADWGLRWVLNHDEVTCVLSNMLDEAQLDENVASANEAMPGCMNEDELAMFADIKKIIFEKTKVGCTGCGYCMPCPFGVDIPACFSCYNDAYLQSFGKARNQYMQVTGAIYGNPSFASRCTECGKCEKHCPQGISIRAELKNVVREMEKFPFRQAMAVARMFSGERWKNKTPRSG